MKYSKNVASFRTSPIRDMMKTVSGGNVISFAGGMPGDDLFPIEDVRQIINECDDQELKRALQYGPTDGWPAFIEEIKKESEKRGFDMTKNRIMITTGSTQAINLISKLLLDTGDVMLTEDPVFVGSLGGFCSFGANVVGVPLDSDGIVIEELEKALQLNPKFIYIIPNFHNPAGIYYTRKRREEFLEVMAKYPEVMIVEDDAYGRLYFDSDIEDDIVPMKVWAKNEQQIIYTSSFSKILGPGLRIGWMVMPNDMFQYAEIAKQPADACSPQISQILAMQYIQSGKLDLYTQHLREVYVVRRDAMVESIKKYCPKELTFDLPRGGFFLWAHMPDGVKVDDVFEACVARGVVFVKGSAFAVDGKDNGYVRLSFSNTSPEQIERGIKILGEELYRLMK